jgi:hypothetical protein
MKPLIIVNQTDVNISYVNNEAYISLADMVKAIGSERDLIGDWMRLSSTIEFLGVWEVAIGNKNFNLREFEDFISAITLSHTSWLFYLIWKC